MIKIDLSGIGKRFQLDWVFKDLSYSFEESKTYAITGPNGSGKSTFIKLILGIENASKGSICYYFNGKEIFIENLYRQLTFAAPYQELIEELTLSEAIELHKKLRGLIDEEQIISDIEHIGLKPSLNKQIRFFSSGMKQRLKLLFAFHSPAALILLDEPTVNLDESGVTWYLEKIKSLHHKKTIIIGSNDAREYEMADASLNIGDFKLR